MYVPPDFKDLCCTHVKEMHVIVVSGRNDAGRTGCYFDCLYFMVLIYVILFLHFMAWKCMLFKYHPVIPAKGWTERRMAFKKTELQPVPVKLPWFHISLNFIASVSPTSSQGNRFILTLSDYFTKFVQVVPLPDKCSSGVARALFKVVNHNYTCMWCANHVCGAQAIWSFILVSHRSLCMLEFPNCLQLKMEVNLRTSWTESCLSSWESSVYYPQTSMSMW